MYFNPGPAEPRHYYTAFANSVDPDQLASTPKMSTPIMSVPKMSIPEKGLLW